MPARKTEINKNQKKKPASPDTLVKGGKTGKPELSEDELKDVAGGYQTGGSAVFKYAAAPSLSTKSKPSAIRRRSELAAGAIAQPRYGFSITGV